MTDRSSLIELANFAGTPASTPIDKSQRPRRADPTLTANLGRNPQRRTVSELLGLVLTLSARTRRAALPPTRIDLDVFRPDGSRAVRLLFERQP